MHAPAMPPLVSSEPAVTSPCVSVSPPLEAPSADALIDIDAPADVASPEPVESAADPVPSVAPVEPSPSPVAPAEADAEAEADADADPEFTPANPSPSPTVQPTPPSTTHAASAVCIPARMRTTLPSSHAIRHPPSHRDPRGTELQRMGDAGPMTTAVSCGTATSNVTLLRSKTRIVRPPNLIAPPKTLPQTGAMNYRIGLGFWLMLGLTGCADDVFDPTERALRGVSSGLQSADETVERATGFSFFGALRERVEDELVPYDDGHWVFPTGQGLVTVAFEEADGAAQQFPGTQTHGMEIEIIEDKPVGGLLDLPGDHRATTTTTAATRGLTEDAVSVSVGYGMAYEHALNGVEVGLSAEVEATVTVGAGCPAGEIYGTVTASGKTPLVRRGRRTLEFVAQYDGGELVWRAYDGSRVVDEGRVPAAAGSGC